MTDPASECCTHAKTENNADGDEMCLFVKNRNKFNDCQSSNVAILFVPHVPNLLNLCS
jgi:hypothetical protein